MTAPAAPGRERPDRNTYLDVIRGIAIFGVACIHFGGSFINSSAAWSPSFYTGLFLSQLFTFAVPLFVFVSGYLSAVGASRHADRPQSSRSWKRLLRIGVPYAICSIVSYYIFGHQAEVNALPTFGQKASWFLVRAGYLGIELTLYFIPLILLLSALFPFFHHLPRLIGRCLPGELTPRRRFSVTAALAATLLCAHIALAILCFRGSLNYYYWARPCPLYWACFFFAGVHLQVLSQPFSARAARALAVASLGVALFALATSMMTLTRRSVVGAHFESSPIDYVYVRPELVAYDLAAVAFIAAGIVLRWNFNPPLWAKLGRHSLGIYLWHILLLYELFWRYPDVLHWCRRLPELIPLVAFFACWIIARLSAGYHELWKFLTGYRVAVSITRVGTSA